MATTRLFGTAEGDVALCDACKDARIADGGKLSVPASAGAMMLGQAPWHTGDEPCVDCEARAEVGKAIEAIAIKQAQDVLAGLEDPLTLAMVKGMGPLPDGETAEEFLGAMQGYAKDAIEQMGGTPKASPDSMSALSKALGDKKLSFRKPPAKPKRTPVFEPEPQIEADDAPEIEL